MTKGSSIIYINFSQYDNTGHILDYLKETFSTVIHFSFDHLRLKHGRKTNLLILYRNKRLITRKTLYSFRVPSFFLFPSLPIVAVLMIIQTVLHTLRLQHYAPRPIFFTVNAYPALVGILLKKLGLVSSTYYWVWDFYPVSIKSWSMKIIRLCYLLFDTIAIHHVDRLIFPNTRQISKRNSIRKIRDDIKIIPLGAENPVYHQMSRSHIVGFLGMMKESQGIDLVIENLKSIFACNPKVTVEIIGSGPGEEYLRRLAKPFGRRVHFFGFIEDHTSIERIVRRWSVGFAVYKPDKSNESNYGDPSKIKVYLSQGVPIITTNVTEYGAKARKYGFGLTIPYDGKHLAQAVNTIRINQRVFRKRALSYASMFYYRNVYKPMFQDL